MNLISIKRQISNLKIRIEKWNNDYYDNNISAVDDSVYDEALKELIFLENKYPQFLTSDSPTQKVSGKASKKFKKIPHEGQKMLSLKNAFNFEDLIHFDNQLKKLIKDNYSYSVEPKIDGVSISLTYKEGKLLYALTRGDGSIGEDVTHNVLNISDIPKTISRKEQISIRGEIYMKLSTFSELNKSREKLNTQIMANPRNAASGTIRQLEISDLENRKLNMFAYMSLDISKGKHLLETQKDNINFLSDNNFIISEYTKNANNIEEVIKVIQEIAINREELDYEIDGVVIKLNETKYYDYIGDTSKFPKWAIAYKFPDEVKKTELIGITPTLGRTGVITYNAILTPVSLSGSIVRKATLHNKDYIQKLDLRIGDIVFVKKAGDIIPKVIGYDKDNRKTSFPLWKPETICPSCKHKLVVPANEVDQYCINESCIGQLLQKLNHFVSKQCMNIDGLGSQQIELFNSLGILNNLIDIYFLRNHSSLILKQHGFTQYSFDKLMTAIELSKKNSLERLIFALGIRYIGSKSSLDLSRKYKTIKRLISITEDELINDRDFGDVRAKSIISWFKSSKNISLISSLKKEGVNFVYLGSSENTLSIFYNKTVLITGSIEGATRTEIKKKLTNIGAKVVSSMSTNIDYLLVGKNPGKSKLSSIEKGKIIEISNISELR